MIAEQKKVGALTTQHVMLAALHLPAFKVLVIEHLYRNRNVEKHTLSCYCEALTFPAGVLNSGNMKHILGWVCGHSMPMSIRGESSSVPARINGKEKYKVDHRSFVIL